MKRGRVHNLRLGGGCWRINPYNLPTVLSESKLYFPKALEIIYGSCQRTLCYQ